MALLSRLPRTPSHYDLFGLIAESRVDLALPGATGRKQVEIHGGTVQLGGEVLYRSAEPPIFGCYRRDDEVLLEWENVRFSITRERVVVDSDHEGSAAHLLVPAVWSVVLAAHQRESLHGAAVAQDGHGVAIMGHSGRGKSTAARGLIERGWQLVSDDLLTFDDTLRVVPGPPWMRFLPDGGGDLLSTPDAGGKVRVHSPISSAPVALCAMVIMEPHYRQCARLTGTSAVSALLQQLYFPALTHEGQAKRRFKLVHDLADRVPIYAAPPRSLSPDQLECIAEGGIK